MISKLIFILKLEVSVYRISYAAYRTGYSSLTVSIDRSDRPVPDLESTVPLDASGILRISDFFFSYIGIATWEFPLNTY